MHVEPLTHTVMQEMLPHLREAEKQRQTAATAHFHHVTTLVGQITIVVFVFSGILAGVLAIVVSGRLQRGLRVLKIGADTLGAGQLEHRIPVQSKDELGDLAARSMIWAKACGRRRLNCARGSGSWKR